MLDTPTSPTFDYYAPVAGWLSRMTALPFGRSRWVSKYYVLLDSELRYYKDEHCDTPAQILNLREVSQAVHVIVPQHPHAFRLEPITKRKEKRSSNQRSPSFINNRNTKPWIIACKTELDKQHWMSAINRRIIKYSPLSSPRTPTDETPVHKRSKSNTNSVFSCTTFCVVSPDVYRSPTAPLRCVNYPISPSITTTNNSKPKKPTSSSLLERRNKALSPIKIPFQTSAVSEDVSVSLNADSAKKRSLPPSPTGAVLGQNQKLVSPTKQFNHKHLLISIPSIQLVPSTNHQVKVDADLMSAESSSPTYSLYKRKFGL